MFQVSALFDFTSQTKLCSFPDEMHIEVLLPRYSDSSYSLFAKAAINSIQKRFWGMDYFLGLFIHHDNDLSYTATTDHINFTVGFNYLWRDGEEGVVGFQTNNWLENEVQ